jgi:hypothetical protein
VYYHDIMSKHSQWKNPTKGWVPKKDKESGKEYFQHKETKERVWEKPIVLKSSSGVTMHPHRIWTQHVDSATGKKFYHNRHSGESKWSHPAEGWSAHIHSESGKPYYYNKETSTSHWSHPVVVGEKEHESPIKNLQEVKKATAAASATGGASGASGGAGKPKENAPPVDHHVDSLEIAMEEAAKHQKELRAVDITELKKASRGVYTAMIRAGLAARKRNRLRKIYDDEREEAVETMSESTFAAHHANHEHHANASDLVVLKSLEVSQDASKRALNETKDLIKAREKWSEAAKEATKDKILRWL